MNKKCETCRYFFEDLRPKSDKIMDCMKKKNPIMNVGKCRFWKKKHDPEMAKLKKEVHQRYKETVV